MLGNLKNSIGQRASNVARNAANITGQTVALTGNALVNLSNRVDSKWNKFSDAVHVALNHNEIVSNNPKTALALTAAAYYPPALAVNVAKRTIGYVGNKLANTGTKLTMPSDNNVSRFLENKSNQIKANTNKVVDLEQIRRMNQINKVALMDKQKQIREREEELIKRTQELIKTRNEESRKQRLKRIGYYGGRTTRRNRKNTKSRKSRRS
jgi:hypothetical protein